jgi:ABC-type lipoprotein export system ATPase subunit
MLLQSENLSYQYKGSSQELCFPDIKLEEGETHLILGNSGSGKTTLLHLLSLILPMQAGKLAILDKEIVKLTNKNIHQFRAQNIGIIHQKPFFVRSLSALENLKLGSYFSKRLFDEKEVEKLSLRLGVNKLLAKRPDELSGGEQQRLSILRAMLNNPKIIFADEPTSNLDDDNCQIAFNSLSELSKENNSTLVIVTHDNRLKSLVKNQTILR